MITDFISTLLNSSLLYPLLIPLAIIIGTFILEDVTTVLVGILAAEGGVGMVVAIFSLYAGIILGDFWLYGMGHMARKHPWAKRFVKHEKLEPFKTWLEDRLMFAIFTSRFVPGMRLPTYTATGFFAMPFKPFATAVVGATCIWTTAFFGVAYLFGAAAEEILGPWKWPVGIALAFGMFFFGTKRVDKILGGK